MGWGNLLACMILGSWFLHHFKRLLENWHPFELTQRTKCWLVLLSDTFSMRMVDFLLPQLKLFSLRSLVDLCSASQWNEAQTQLKTRSQEIHLDHSLTNILYIPCWSCFISFVKPQKKYLGLVQQKYNLKTSGMDLESAVDAWHHSHASPDIMGQFRSNATIIKLHYYRNRQCCKA